VTEHAMGRQVGGKVERAYTGATPLEKPRELMDARANYCKPATDDNVVALKSSA